MMQSLFHLKSLESAIKIISGIILGFILFTGCKKSNTVTFTGQLLFSDKNRVPVRNKKIEIYQKGSPPAIGINAYSSSSSAMGTTDVLGNFSVKFTPGRSEFIIFSGPNQSPLVLHNAYDDTTYPGFSRVNFSDSTYDPSQPIYIAKVIKQVSVYCQLQKDLQPTDTLGIRIPTRQGLVTKDYTNLSGTAGSKILIDVFPDFISTGYDCATGQYANPVQAGKRWTTTWGYSALQSGFVYPSTFSAGDEAVMDMVFHF